MAPILMGANLDNIDRFNTLVGLIFDQLYREFPLQITLDANVFALAMGVGTDEAEMRKNEPKRRPLPGTKTKFIDFYRSTLTWLRMEGFIHASIDPDENVVLSAKGLAILNATPSVIGEKSLGKKLGDAAKDVGTDVANKAIADLAGQALGAFTKSVFGL